MEWRVIVDACEREQGRAEFDSELSREERVLPRGRERCLWVFLLTVIVIHIITFLLTVIHSITFIDSITFIHTITLINSVTFIHIITHTQRLNDEEDAPQQITDAHVIKENVHLAQATAHHRLTLHEAVLCAQHATVALSIQQGMMMERRNHVRMGVEMNRRRYGNRQDFRHPLGKGVIAFLRLLPGIRLDSFLVSRECLQEKRRTEMTEG